MVLAEEVGLRGGRGRFGGVEVEHVAEVDIVGGDVGIGIESGFGEQSGVFFVNERQTELVDLMEVHLVLRNI